MKIALQLYTIRDAIHSGGDLIAALRRVREMGYEGVEFAGTYGLAPQRLREALDEAGLTAVSSHESLDDLERRPEAVIEAAASLGMRHIACAYSPTGTAEEVARTVRVMREAGEKCAARGITLAYHNHAHEFVSVEGALPIEAIKAVCPLEPDTYWIFHAGRAAAEYLRGNRERVTLVHLKDGDGAGHPCAVGEGQNDIAAIMQAAEEIGAPWVIVENDNPAPDGLSDAARSREALRRLGY